MAEVPTKPCAGCGTRVFQGNVIWKTSRRCTACGQTYCSDCFADHAAAEATVSPFDLSTFLHDLRGSLTLLTPEELVGSLDDAAVFGSAENVMTEAKCWAILDAKASQDPRR